MTQGLWPRWPTTIQTVTASKFAPALARPQTSLWQVWSLHLNAVRDSLILFDELPSLKKLRSLT